MTKSLTTQSLLSNLSEFTFQWSPTETQLQDGIFPCPGPYHVSNHSPNSPAQRSRIHMAFYCNGRFHIALSPNSPHVIIDLMTRHDDIVVSGDYFGMGRWNAAVYSTHDSCLYVYLGRATDAFAMRIAKLVRARGSACSARLEEYEMDLEEEEDQQPEKHYRLIVRFGANASNGVVPVPRCYMPSTGPNSAAMTPNTHAAPRTQFALYHPSTCTFEIFPDILNTNQTLEISFGDAHDIPIPADYLGTGFSQLALYRPNTGEWFILHELNSYAECTILKASYRASPKHDVPLPFFYRNRSLPAIWKPHEQNLFLCHDLSDWTLETGGIIRCDTANWDDIPMIVPHSSRASNICFAKTSGKWCFNQVRQVQEYGVGSGADDNKSTPSSHVITAKSQWASTEKPSSSKSSPNLHKADDIARRKHISTSPPKTRKSVSYAISSPDEDSTPSTRSRSKVTTGPPSPLRKSLQTLSTNSSLSPHRHSTRSSLNSSTERASIISDESIDIAPPVDSKPDICLIRHQDSGSFVCSHDGLRLTLAKTKNTAKCQFEWIDRMYLMHVSSGKYITAKGSMLLLDDKKSDSFLLLGGSCLRHEDGLFCEVTPQGDVILGGRGADFEFEPVT